jgi:methyl-accepting chemotaxis protein
MKLADRLAAWLSGARWKARDIRGCLAVLPLLRAQLREVSEQVEQAVVLVCRNFSAIAERSRKAVDKSTELLAGDPSEQDATIDKSIAISRATIAALLDRLERAGNVSSMVVSRMEQVEHAVGGIESLLEELRKIAFSNKLVALNAKIEAVHVGKLGSGFEVVADEIARQGDRSNELAEGIGERIREMRDRVNGAARDLRTVAAEDREKLVESRSEAEGALNMLCSVHQRARESLAMMASENTQLAGEISAAVVGLQFQDRTGQRIAHVVEALEKVEENLGGAARPLLASSSLPPDRGGSLLDGVRESYTMDSERTVLERSLPEPVNASQGGDVELF